MGEIVRILAGEKLLVFCKYVAQLAQGVGKWKDLSQVGWHGRVDGVPLEIFREELVGFLNRSFWDGAKQLWC